MTALIDLRKAAYHEPLSALEAGMVAAAKGTSLHPSKSPTGWQFTSRKTGHTVATWAGSVVLTPAGQDLGHAHTAHDALHLAITEERRRKAEVRT